MSTKKTVERKIHQFAKIFPLLGDADRAVLRKSLEENGQREEIVLFDGQVLDGQNRYREMIDLGLEPVFRDYDKISDGADPFAFVWDKNFTRRQLTASQKAALIVERSRILAERGSKTESVEVEAAKVHVSPSTAHAAARIERESPELFQQLKDGTTTVHAANVELGHAQSTSAADAPPAKKNAAKKAPAKKAAPKDDEEAEALKALRKEMFPTVEHLHGEEFAGALKRGTILKTLKELKAFHKCNDEEQSLIVPYIVQGWEVARATKFVVKSIADTDPIRDLIFRFNATGKKSETFKIAGFNITVKKAE